MSRIRAVLFDLDGTLADTAPDLGHALNLLLASHNLAPLPLETIRPVASHGARGLIELGFNVHPEDTAYANLRQDFLNHYENNLCLNTSLFAGAKSLLDKLESRLIPWGIVTNKPMRYTYPLVQALGLADRAGCCVCGDTTSHSKPHPEPLLFAAHQLNIKPETCLYLGDAQRDIEAARSAGMTALVARYGYLSTFDQPDTWQASGLIDTPEELLNHL
ncbi:MAG: HAD-IA family hydrolase [Pseudomonadota bacterium]|nr:HAD-IA family hydrolase [Pseudomonadota bacterium]